MGNGSALASASIVNNSSGRSNVNGLETSNGLIFYNGSAEVTSATLGSQAGSGNLKLQAGTSGTGSAVTLTVGGNNAGTTYSGSITGSGSLAKTGTGAMTLSGSNAYTGATTINGDVLNLTGSLNGSGAVTVNSVGALAGTGRVSGATTVAGGGALSPGSGGAGVSGTLTFSNALTLNHGAVLTMDLSGTGSSDKIVAGTVSASGTTTVNLNALAGFAGAGTYPLIGGSRVNAANFAVGTAPGGYGYVLSVSNAMLLVTVQAPLTAQQLWRLANFGTTENSGNAADSADPDGDGWTNAQEFASGTDPNDRASALKIDSMGKSGNDMVIGFPTVLGKTYRVERSANLLGGSWTTVQDNIPGTGASVQVTDAGGTAQTKRFYRIVAH